MISLDQIHHRQFFNLRSRFIPINMPFVAEPRITGVPDFGLVHIDPEQTARAFQTYLDTASRLTGVSLEDIDRSVISQPPNAQTVTLVDLLKLGMKLFDAVIWLTAGRPQSHPLEVDAAMTLESIPSMHDIARSVFYCYFFLIVQARYPTGRSSTEAPKVPNFLTTIMGMDKPQHEYVETICSFEPQKFDPAWARYVSFRSFGQETLSRFGLGVAGYRLFTPFGIYDPKPNISQNLMNAFTFARTVARAPNTWNLHPLTRDPNVLTVRGNLNKNLGNLILEVFTDEQIEEMVRSKMLFARPEHQPTMKQYLTWAANDDISGNSRIFPDPPQ
jgi:hypothetical protein